MVLILLCVCMCAEARGLVRALIQPDPTVRLTAEQTLQHPWVKAMASVCRQRALTDKTQRNRVANGAEPDRVQRLVPNNAAEIDETPGHVDSGEEIIHKELSTSLEATPGQQGPGCYATGSPSREASRPVIQDPGPVLSNTGHRSDCRTSFEHKQLSGPSAQTDPPAMLKTQSKQTNIQQQPHSPSPPNQEQQTTTGRSTQQHPFSNLATASSAHSLYQQNYYYSPPVQPHPSHSPKPPSPTL